MKKITILTLVVGALMGNTVYGSWLRYLNPDYWAQQNVNRIYRAALNESRSERPEYMFKWVNYNEPEERGYGRIIDTAISLPGTTYQKNEKGDWVKVHEDKHVTDFWGRPFTSAFKHLPLTWVTGEGRGEKRRYEDFAPQYDYLETIRNRAASAFLNSLAGKMYQFRQQERTENPYSLLRGASAGYQY